MVYSSFLTNCQISIRPRTFFLGELVCVGGWSGCRREKEKKIEREGGRKGRKDKRREEEKEREKEREVNYF